MPDRCAVVTGAGGDIGGACAHRLATSHDVVLCVDTNRQRAAETASRIAESGGNAQVLVHDAADADFGDRIADAAHALGPVAAVVHALAHEQQQPAESISRDSVALSFAVGPLAAFGMFRALFTRKCLAGGASLVTIGSLHATTPFPRCIGYNAAHAALAHIVRSLAHEWSPHRIRVNSVVPGWIRTNGETALYGNEFLDHVAGLLPFGRFGSPADVAAAVEFLCSEKSDYISGAFLTVDGALQASLARLPEGPTP